MAKNEEVKDDDAAAAKAVEAAAKKKKLVMLGIIGAVLLLVGGGGTWFALKSLGGDKEAGAEVKAEEHAEAGHGENAAHKEAVYLALDEKFLANYNSGGRPHYLQLSLALMAYDEAALEAAKTHMPLLRNRVVMILSGEVFEQLQTDEGRVQLQQKLLAAMQEILQKETGKPQIEKIFFTAFVLQ